MLKNDFFSVKNLMVSVHDELKEVSTQLFPDHNSKIEFFYNKANKTYTLRFSTGSLSKEFLNNVYFNSDEVENLGYPCKLKLTHSGCDVDGKDCTITYFVKNAYLESFPNIVDVNDYEGKGKLASFQHTFTIHKYEGKHFEVKQI
ncbi:hypothetical protein [Priestia megaterium]|uniref:hypothetical protein n=1 Tax=Priestia megaterium TaxID=1404 RepID=UPI0011289E68|nr:hypothetical protein [Priestia megaterium]TPF18109.1 hypothetical protein CBE78_02445 [Priestia megaterium]TPF22216.1 hypothetical protein CBE79_04950 [Priestia megaterium]